MSHGNEGPRSWSLNALSYEATIRDLEREAQALERRLQVIKSALASLRALSRGGEQLSFGAGITLGSGVVIGGAAPYEPVIIGDNVKMSTTSPAVAPRSGAFVPKREPAASMATTTSEMVREFVAAHPGECTSSEIADALAKKVRSSTSNPRKLVINTVHYLVSRVRQLRRDDDGRIWPREGDSR